MAWAPSVTAGTSLNPPPNLPIGVRAPATITDPVMSGSLRFEDGVDLHSRSERGGDDAATSGIRVAEEGQRQWGALRRWRPRLRRRGALVERGRDDGRDLLAHQLVPLDQRVAQGRDEVSVLLEYLGDALLLCVKEGLDTGLRVGVRQDLADQVLAS